MKVGIASKSGSSDLYAVLHTENLLNVLDSAQVLEGELKGNGDGTRDQPYNGLNMGKWRSLAKQDPKKDAPIYYSVGKRLLVRWGENMGGLVNYGLHPKNETRS